MSVSVVATDFGGPEVLSVIDEPVRAPGPGEVVIDVRAAGVNPIDFKLYSGYRGKDPSALPMHLGLEVSGVVAAVGDDAKSSTGELRLGDEVIAYPVLGGYASQVVVAAANVVPKPSALSFEEAGGLILTGATAVHAVAVVDVAAGDTLLVHGASGAVGLTVVQLAVGRGARVIGTASEGRHALLRELGCEPVTYGDGIVERVRAIAPDGVDVVIDTVGGDEATDASLELANDSDRIVTIVGSERAFDLGFKVIGNAPGADPGAEIRAHARLELVNLVEAGKLRVFVAGTYPLVEAAAAHKELMQGHTHGKLLLVP
jgi:NADPH2:quinone reductase